ncbi:MAG: xanthine dehydrogenase family protein molybdopterin-binding subunit [Pseudomonadota bacterium]
MKKLGQLRPELPSRRQFIKTAALASGGFLIGCGSEPASTPVAEASAPEPTVAPPVPIEAEFNAFVKVGSDNVVTVVVKHLDKGQGITTGLATIVAEELDADFAQMQTEFAPADAKVYVNTAFGVQGTGGSTSIANSWMQLRQAGAAARAMLVEAAAAAWSVPAAEITVAKGMLSHAASGQSGSFGEFADAAGKLTPPANPSLKDPADFTLIGTRVQRLDTPGKTSGETVFTLDIQRDGMLEAVVAHPPRFGGKVGSFDATAAKAVPGVVDVVEIPRGIAVLADSYWSALKGRQALTIEWDDSGAEMRGSAELTETYRAALAEPGEIARGDGDATAAVEGGDDVLSLEFEFPFLAHATMEPMDCVVELSNDQCEIWTGSQLQTVDQMVAAGITGLTPDKVIIHTHYAGGSFGRRAVPDSDYIAEAVMIAKAIGGRAPVKLHWSREDDMTAGRYRPLSVHRLEGTVADGKIDAWRHRMAISSFLKGSAFEAMIQNGVDGSAVEGARGLPYAIPNLAVEQHLMEVGVTGLWWRSVGHTHNGYVTEVFFDQLAHKAGVDPYELRRDLLKDKPRHLAVLELAAEKAGWGTPLEAGRARGIAVHESFASFVAEVAEVTVKDDGSFSVDRVVCAVDCGVAINPDVVAAQMEGGIAYGLSAFLREAVTLEEGVVQQRNFDSYRPLRINEMPAVEVHIVPSGEAPTGVGEPGLPPIAPAVANALFAATGKLVTTLPVADQLKTA